MLELAQVVGDIQLMGAEARRRGDRVAATMQAALAQAALDKEAWAATRAQRESLPPPPWLVADCKDTPPGAVCPLPGDEPDIYTALATGRLADPPGPAMPSHRASCSMLARSFCTMAPASGPA